jgi:putative ABC transport system permease protein
MWFITFVFKNLLRRPLRSALTVTAVAIAIAALVALVGVANGFERSFMELYDTEGIDLIVIQKGVIQPISSKLPERLRADIEAVPGVRDVLPGLAEVINQKVDGEDRALILQGWIPETKVFEHLRFIHGKTLTRKDVGKIIVGTIMAENLNLKVGDSLELVDKEFQVVGIYESSHVYENGALVAPLKELQDLLLRGDVVSGYSIILDEKEKRDEAGVERMRQRIEAVKPGLLNVQTPEDFVRKMFEIRLAKGMAWVTSAIALLIGLFGMMNTMVMSVHERTREIGILRAVGWRPGRVIKMILLEAVVLSIVGALVGILGAVVLIKVLAKLPIANSFVEGSVSPWLMLYGQALAIGVGLLGGAIPALRAARMLPNSALRYE